MMFDLVNLVVDVMMFSCSDFVKSIIVWISNLNNELY